MLGPSRPVPRAGARARIVHFGGGAEDVVVERVGEEGRRLWVRSEGGETIEFALNPATARFMTVDGSHGGPRLELLSAGDEGG
jgi:hypothetical protein